MMKKLLLLALLLTISFAQSSFAQEVFINEIHYDNDGGDSGEAIEIAGPAGTDLAGWSLVLYNGNGGAVYDTETLSGVISDQQAGFGTLSFAISGIQNGAPDGIALVNASNSVVQFLSYEGSFTAVGGVADGMVSEDIGVSESSSTPVGYSLQLTGTGSVYEDFTWQAASEDNFAAINAGQLFETSTPTVFINEIHYDNDGGDTGEAIELAGTAGTDLAGWSLVLYNGNGGAEYHTENLSGVIPDQQAGFGTLSFAISGIQNGGPDGIALVDASDNVIQFLSYEGSFTAVGAAADGLTSEDIGVSESSSTPVGFSLQLTGTGTVYEDFAWQAASDDNFGAVNTDQVFGDPVIPTAPVFINEIHYDNASTDEGEAIELAGPAGTDLAGWSLVLYNGNGGASYNTITLSGTIPDEQAGYGTLSFAATNMQNGAPDGIALVDAASDVIQFLSYEGSFTAVDGPANGMTSEDIGVSESSSTPVGHSLQLTGSGTAYEDFTWQDATDASFGSINVDQYFSIPTPTVFVNEIHYDNASTDEGEAIELAGSAGTDLAGWSLVLYNGNGGASYNTISLSGTIPDQQAGYGTLNFAATNMQNGAPDGIALVDAANNVIQFLSYEGSFAAVDGPANGMTSEDIGVSESSSTPVGHSLQLTGTGTTYEDFTWQAPAASTFGAINTDQNFGTTPNPSTLSEGFSDGLGLFTAYSVTGTQAWTTANYGLPAPCAKMSGYSSGAYVNEDWLISPALDFSSVPAAQLSFDEAANYESDVTGNCQVLVSTDYSGSGDPTSASWDVISMPSRAAGNNWTFVSSGIASLNAYLGNSNVYVAFKYTSTSSAAGTWELDNILIENTPAPTINFEFVNESFDNELGVFTAYDVTGTQAWATDNYGVPAPCAKMTGYSSGTFENEDWLIAPSLDFSTATAAQISFDEAANYESDVTGNCQVLVSTNYSGSGNPNSASWSVISMPSRTAGDSWTFISTGIASLDAYLGNSNVYVAFKYTSTTSSAGTWELDNILIEGTLPETSLPPVISNVNRNPLANVAPDVTVSVSSEIIDNEGTVSTATLLWGTSAENLTNNITMTNTSGNVFETSSSIPGQVSGTTVYYQVSATDNDNNTATSTVYNYTVYEDMLDVVTYNIEWLGAPSKADLSISRDEQLTMAAQDILTVGADVYALQEIVVDDVNGDALTDLVAKLNTLDASDTWEGVYNTYFSYYWNPDFTSFPAQRQAFVYRTSTITQVSNETLLTSIPEGDNRFASGRLPFKLEADVTINGVTQRMNFINLHLKCCTGNASRRLNSMQDLVTELTANYSTSNVVVLGDFNVADNGGADGEIATWGIYDDNDNNGTPDYYHAAGALTDLAWRDIDHVLISDELNDEYLAAPVDIRNQTLNSTVSDHKPVVARLLLMPALEVAGKEKTDVNCSGNNDGTATVSATGGVEPYTYEWSDGQTTQTAVNLVAGTYDVYVTDATGTTVTEQVVVNESAPIELTMVENQKVYDGYPDASTATLSVTEINGGTPEYSYEWSNGETSESIVVAPEETTTYTLTVTDANNCSASGDVLVNVEDISCGYGFFPRVLVCYRGWTFCVPTRLVPWLMYHGVKLGRCHKKARRKSAPIAAENFAEMEEALNLESKAFPNPFTDQLVLSVESETVTDIEILVYSTTGELVHAESRTVGEGKTLLDVELGDLQQGTYLLKTIGLEKSAPIRIVKK